MKIRKDGIYTCSDVYDEMIEMIDNPKIAKEMKKRKEERHKRNFELWEKGELKNNIKR